MRYLLLALGAATALAMGVFLPLQPHFAPQQALRLASLPAEAATVTLGPITNDTDQAANDLQVTVAGSGGPISNAQLVQNAPGCGTAEVIFEGNLVKIIWGSRCVDPGESVTIEVETPSPNTVISGVVWTIDGVAIADTATPTPTTTPTPTPTRTSTPTFTPTPTPFPRPSYKPGDWNATGPGQPDLTDLYRDYLSKGKTLADLIRDRKLDPAMVLTQLYNNCYNYACNKKQRPGIDQPKAQPGRASKWNPDPAKNGVQYKFPDLKDCKEVVEAAKADGLQNFDKDCKTACAASTHKKALVVYPNVDYHWYREDADGKWSHKPGATKATNKSRVTDPGDSAPDTIDDIEEVKKDASDRGYTKFCGCFCCSNDPNKVNKR